MPILAFEVIHVDEDQAEKAVLLAIETIKPITKSKKDSVVIEPHDGYRGVWARIEIEEPEHSTKVFRESIVRYLKHYVETLLYKNAKAHVLVTLSKTEGDK